MPIPEDCPACGVSLVGDGDALQAAVSDDELQTLLSQMLEKLRRLAVALGAAPCE